jgi:hypothetical protein
MIVTAYQHGAGGSGGIQKLKNEFAKSKTPKGGQKEPSQREGHDGRASRVKTSKGWRC